MTLSTASNCARAARRARCVVVSLVLLLACPVVPASDTTYADLTGWLEAHGAAPDDGLAAGSYGAAELPALARYLPPGLVEEFDFPELELELVPTARYAPHPDYLAATRAHQGQAELAADGAITGYVAGQPFTAEQIAKATPEQAGHMVAWNHIFRWQNDGYHVKTVLSYVLEAPPGKGRQTAGMEGGGHVDREITAYYQRVYLAALAHRAGDGYRIDLEGSAGLHWKEYLEFIDPFNIKGTRFVVERALDPTLGDQVYSYLASERRVRRLSAKERADSWMGTNMTLDDFEGFSGRVLDYHWRYLGQKVVLHVSNSRHETAMFFGPRSHIAHDRWQLRRCHVVEVTPTWDDHPYARRVQFIDAESFNTVMSLVFDHDDSLWKVFYTVNKHEPVAPDAPVTHAASVHRWAATVAMDLDARTTTLAREVTPAVYTDVVVDDIKRMFDVSSLTEGR
jgi:hypothetical protein